jgi:hypothetical protein
MERVRIAIIGTAGRKEDAAKITKELFQNMVNKAEDIITKEWNFSWEQVDLLSGGAAVSDHVAVILYLKHVQDGTQLTLELPCDFDDGRFIDTGRYDYISNPGRTSNYYHDKFSKIMQGSSLLQIQTALDIGASSTISQGFFDRNTKVAKKSTHIIAFTFGDGKVPKDGGTKFTWDCAKNIVKKHVPLSDLAI